LREKALCLQDSLLDQCGRNAVIDDLEKTPIPTCAGDFVNRGARGTSGSILRDRGDIDNRNRSAKLIGLRNRALIQICLGVINDLVAALAAAPAATFKAQIVMQERTPVRADISSGATDPLCAISHRGLQGSTTNL
jgi:hypothetical protein